MAIEYRLNIKTNNVVEQHVDFIVNASNTKLRLGSGVSMCFAKHCGESLQEEMSTLLKEVEQSGYFLKKGDVIPTSSADATNFMHAFHAVTIDSNQRTNWREPRTTLDDVKQALCNVECILNEYCKLYSKEDLSLAIPLLGCGVGGLDKKDVLSIYQEFFIKDKACAHSFRCDVWVCI